MSVSFELAVETLHHACFGSNLVSQQNAMKKLQEFESNDGIVSILVTIIEQSSCWKMEIRLLSSISLKNIVVKRWTARGKTVNVVRDEDKSLLRKFVLSYLNDPESKILLQLAICASKIARCDWPERWPTLFSDLFEVYEFNKDLIKQRRILYILHECVRELSEKNMPQTKSSLAIATVDIFNFSYTIWSDYCKILLERLEISHYEHIDYILEHVYIITRIMRKSLERGYIEIDSSNINLGYFYSQFVSYFERLAFIINSFQQQNLLSEYCNSELHDFEVNDDIFSFQVEKHISHTSSSYGAVIVVPALIKLVKDMAMIPTVLQKDYPLEIGRYLAAFLEFYRKQLFEQYNFIENSPTQSEMILNWNPLNYSLCTSAVVFLSNSISCQKYVNVEETRIGFEESYEISKNDIVENTNDSNSHMASVTRNTFFSDDAVLSFLKLCIHRLLRYSTDEIDEWQMSPEQFFLSQQDLSEENNLKTASEAFFLGLLDKNPVMVCNVLISYVNDRDKQFQMIQFGSQSEVQEEIILFYSSVYLCAGLAASTLSQYGHAIDWITQIVGPILTALLQNIQLTKGQQLLRIRLLWLLSCFMYQFNANILTDILNLISITLSSGNNIDTLCLLTAIETLHAILKSDLFQPNIHESYLPGITSMLCVIMTRRLEENEAKQICVNVIGR